MPDVQGSNQATLVLAAMVVGLMIVLAILGAAFVLKTPSQTTVAVQSPPTGVTQSTSSQPATIAPGGHDDEEQIREMLEAWRLAWERQDLDRFMSFYSQDFRGEGMDWTAWRANKRDTFRKYSQIRVDVDDVAVHIDGSEAELSFTQGFTGSGPGSHYSSDGRTHMLLRKDAGDWLIVSERFYKM